MPSTAPSLRHSPAVQHPLLEHLYVFGHHGFLQTVPTPSSTWTQRPAAVVLVSADTNPLALQLKDDRVVTGRVIAVAPMVERRLMQPHPLLSFNVQPVHPGFPVFRALHPHGAMALRPEPFVPLADTFAAACVGTPRADDLVDVFDEVVASVRDQLPPIGSPDERLAAVIAHLHEHPRATAGDLGAVVGRSGDWVSRTFSAGMGISLRDYVGWLKQRALFDTLFSGRSITDLALDAGFAGASQFASAYQRWYGRTPSASRDPARVRVRVARLAQVRVPE